MEGHVLDEHGTPIADAILNYYTTPVTTDEAGFFAVAVKPNRDELTLDVIAEGYAEQRVTVDTRSSEVDFVEIVMIPEFRLRGMVSNAEGQPLENASVTAFSRNAAPVQTNSLGAFELPHLDPRRDAFFIKVTREGFAPVTTRFDRAAEQPISISLPAGIDVSGNVVDEEGQGIKDVLLRVGHGPHDWSRVETTSVADGSFFFTDLSPGDHVLWSSREGYAPTRQPLNLSDGQRPLHGIVITLLAPAFLGGVVVDANGAPLPDTFVSAKQHGQYLDGLRASSDQDGRFSLKGLPRERVSLELYRTGFVHQSVPIDELDHDLLEISMQPSGSVTGLVIDGVTKEPIDHFIVRFRSDVVSSGERGHLVTHQHGHARGSFSPRQMAGLTRRRRTSSLARNLASRFPRKDTLRRLKLWMYRTKTSSRTFSSCSKARRCAVRCSRRMG